jgi:hypothetical protein
VPGSVWHSVDPDTFAYERMNATAIPNDYRFAHYGISAHYGLIGWGSAEQRRAVPYRGAAAPSTDRLFHVVIDEHGSADTNPNVPAARREPHQAAVDALRRASAIVDAANFSPEVGTGVLLTAIWRDRSGGLLPLKDLYNLRTLCCFHSTVDDEGLRHLATLEELRVLQLVANQTTDQGLVHLQGLRHLTRLWLEGRADAKGFTDAGLAHLKDLPRLEELTLYGPGFTDAAAPRLLEFRSLKRVRFVGTGVNPTTVDELRQKMGQVQWIVE